MGDSKSIEDMAHDYAVAAIKSGKTILREDIDRFCMIAADVKSAAKKIQKDIDEDQRRRRW